MSVELTLLIASTLLVLAYIGTQSILYRMQHGVIFAGGARDGEAPPDRLNARGEKALRNLLETYGIFIALAVATELSGRSDALTQWGAQIWFWARWAYLPLYIAGVPYLRSIVWLVSMAGLVLLLVGVAF